MGGKQGEVGFWAKNGGGDGWKDGAGAEGG